VLIYFESNYSATFLAPLSIEGEGLGERRNLFNSTFLGPSSRQRGANPMRRLINSYD